jgi:hypothetical protein
MRFSAACISLAALAFLAHCVRVFLLAAFAFLNLFTPAMLFVQFLFVFDAVFCSSHLVRVFSLVYTRCARVPKSRVPKSFYFCAFVRFLVMPAIRNSLQAFDTQLASLLAVLHPSCGHSPNVMP